MRDIAEDWLEDPDFRAEYDALEPEFALASALIAARSQPRPPAPASASASSRPKHDLTRKRR